MKVKGPNGLVFDWPKDLVESLLKSGGFEAVREVPKTQKPAPKK